MDAPAIAQLLGLGNWLISEVRMSGLDRARDAIDLVATAIDAPVRVVEHAIFGEDLVDSRTPALGIVSPRKAVCELRLGWLETDTLDRVRGDPTIRDVFQCSTEDSKTILGDLRVRKLVDLEITPGGQLDARKPMLVAQWRSIPATPTQSEPPDLFS